MRKPLISVIEVSKTFPGGIVALDRVSLDIYGGEFTAILGENGSGKSTLVKILYGIYTPDRGVIEVQGVKTTIPNPKSAIKKGIVMVSQIPQLIDRLTVAENIALSLTKLGLMSRVKKASLIFEELGEKIGIKVDPNAKVWSLTYTQKQLVEIARAILLDAKVLLLDEALTYLPIEERRRFYKYLAEFKEKGRSVVFITHKIPEALEIADRIYVLRRGKVVGSLTRSEATLDKIRELMFGEAAKEITYERFSTPYDNTPGKPVIEVENLRVIGDYGELAVNNVSLVVKEGEIVGIAGVAGNGQRELIEAVVGLREVENGKVVVNGIDVTNKGVKAVREAGVGFIPDQPLRYSSSPEDTVLENIAALFSRRNLHVDWNKMKALADKLISEFSIYPPSRNVCVKLLSGGNMMKVIVSRELTYASKALVAYNPTRGLDEVTACFTRRKMYEKARKERAAVLLTSEDLDEVLQLSDVVYVMNRGTLLGPFDPIKTPRSEIEHAMVM